MDNSFQWLRPDFGIRYSRKPSGGDEPSGKNTDIAGFFKVAGMACRLQYRPGHE
jgi:hypothetical protein